MCVATVYLAVTGPTQCTHTQSEARPPAPHEIQYSRYTSPRSAPVPGQSEHNMLKLWPIATHEAQIADQSGSKADRKWQRCSIYKVLLIHNQFCANGKKVKVKFTYIVPQVAYHHQKHF